MTYTIISSRKIYHNPSWQIVYEWEDDFFRACKAPIKELESLKKSFFQKFFFQEALFPFMPKLKSSEYKLFFTMVAAYEFNFFSRPNYIPIVIDAWKPDLWRIEKFYKYNEYLFLGSLEAVQELNNKGMGNVFYSPVSISKKYQCLSYPKKEIDLLVYGRNHEIMWDWINKLLKSKLHIVTCYPDEKGSFNATSNKKGIIGKVDKREDLMLLLKKSKYSAVSSTGNDKRNTSNYVYTGGFSPVTPRFLECTVNYCQGVGVWNSNPDFDHFQIDKIAIKTTTFDQFEEAVTKEIESNQIKETFNNFLEQHWSSKRVEDIIKRISN